MRPHIALATAVTLALALIGTGCGHADANDGLLKDYRPPAARHAPATSTHVSSSRLPASGNAQAREPQADPVGPAGSQSSQAPIAASNAAAPVDLDAEADQATPSPQSDEPDMADVAAALAAGEPEPADEPTVEAYADEPVADTYADEAEADSYADDEPVAEAHSDAAPEHGAVSDVAPARLTVRVKGQPNRCKVAVCGQMLGRAPFRERQVTSGRHLVTIKCPKGRSYEQVLDLEPGRASAVFLEARDLKKQGKARKQRRRRPRI